MKYIDSATFTLSAKKIKYLWDDQRYNYSNRNHEIYLCVRPFKKLLGYLPQKLLLVLYQSDKILTGPNILKLSLYNSNEYLNSTPEKYRTDKQRKLRYSLGTKQPIIKDTLCVRILLKN